MWISKRPHLFLCAALVACGGSSGAPRAATPEETAKLYPELAATAAVTLSKAEPPPGCVLIGTVQGGGWSAEDAYDSMRKKAAERGANYVVLDGIANGIFGRAFSCPPQQAAGVRSYGAPPAAQSCEPACSPGFACVRGTCVSACNPACTASQSCGADRVCHATN